MRVNQGVFSSKGGDDKLEAGGESGNGTGNKERAVHVKQRAPVKAPVGSKFILSSMEITKNVIT